MDDCLSEPSVGIQLEVLPWQMDKNHNAEWKVNSGKLHKLCSKKWNWIEKISWVVEDLSFDTWIIYVKTKI